MLGAAGYAWQGSPTLAGHAPDPRAATPAEDPQLAELRDKMLGRFTLDGAYLVAADAMSMSGDDKAAVRVLLGGIGKLPQSYGLWTGLGTALCARTTAARCRRRALRVRSGTAARARATPRLPSSSAWPMPAPATSRRRGRSG